MYQYFLCNCEIYQFDHRAAGARHAQGRRASTDEDLQKPLVGVANTWTEIGPCNFHLRELAAAVKEGMRAAGGTPMEFNTVSVNDGITMGTEGMRASLVSREVIADSIELSRAATSSTRCGARAAATRRSRARRWRWRASTMPGLVLYGGSIAPGRFEDRDVTIQDVFEAVGAHAPAG
jgi:dihydroxy-acid dehydratase